MLTKSSIVDGLRHLGLAQGSRVMVHASLPAFGEVDGGPDTVIDALLEAVGPGGLVVMPTFGTVQPFDRRTASTSLGAVPERFWRREGARRSKHPTHSVAAMGAGADALILEHEKAPTAYAQGTPYHTLATGGGLVLLMGVDQDRNTTLHTAEALAGVPYLSTVEAAYVDDDGSVVTVSVAAMAGPHRNFIGLEPLFRDKVIVRKSRIGRAVCRLMDGGRMLEAATGAMRNDPNAVLCGNPACADCVAQRSLVKAARLREEDFQLAAVAADISDEAEELMAALRAEAVAAVEVTLGEYERHGSILEKAGFRIAAVRDPGESDAGVALASRLGVALIIPVHSTHDLDRAARIQESSTHVLVENRGVAPDELQRFFSAAGGRAALAFNPGQFAAVGENPFLSVFYRGVLRRKTAHFYVDDATFDGRPALPGYGNGEVKEILSALRCRSFDGYVTLRSPERGVQAFRGSARAFWTLLETM